LISVHECSEGSPCISAMAAQWFSTRLLLWLAIGARVAASAVVAGKRQPWVSGRVDKLEAGSVAAKLAGSRQRAVAGLLRSRSAGARASAVEMQVQQLVMQTQSKKAVLEEMSSQATSQSTKAALSSASAVKLFKGMKASSKTMDAEAGLLAEAAVEHLFDASFDNLQGWRESVLKDPASEAKIAVAKAEEPYKKAQAAFKERIQEYVEEAQSLAEQSNEAIARAGTIARGANQKQQQGDVIGASQDMELARATMQEGQGYAQSAKTLQASAEGMQRQTTLYATALGQAAAKASYDTNPVSLPAMEVDPNLAYTPPPVV